jgi:hypothetical protein
VTASVDRAGEGVGAEAEGDLGEAHAVQVVADLDAHPRRQGEAGGRDQVQAKQAARLRAERGQVQSVGPAAARTSQAQ